MSFDGFSLASPIAAPSPVKALLAQRLMRVRSPSSLTSVRVPPPKGGRASDVASCSFSGSGSGQIGNVPATAAKAPMTLRSSPPPLRLHAYTSHGSPEGSYSDNGDGRHHRLIPVGDAASVRGTFVVKAGEEQERFGPKGKKTRGVDREQNIISRVDCYEDLTPLLESALGLLSDDDGDMGSSAAGTSSHTRSSGSPGGIYQRISATVAAALDQSEAPPSEREAQLRHDLSEILVGIAAPARMPGPLVPLRRQQQ